MKHPDIDVHFNSVFVEKQHLKRPPNFSASEWCHWWETIREFDPDEVSSLRSKLGEAINEIRELETTIQELREENYRLEREP